MADRSETRASVALSFRIVDRIHDILEEKGPKQKDLALKLGKSEVEIIFRIICLAIIIIKLSDLLTFALTINRLHTI